MCCWPKKKKQGKSAGGNSTLPGAKTPDKKDLSSKNVSKVNPLQNNKKKDAPVKESSNRKMQGMFCHFLD